MGGLSHTVSGNIASFRTPSKVPIESLKFHFLPKQAAGTPSPENPIPIEGWTGLTGWRGSKNIGHIIGYSAASMNSPTASKVLTNAYGTTINTRDFASPDTPLVITQEQTSSWDPTVPHSYKNGYFCVGFDNLIFDKSYDFSFKITNVLSDPLNAGINSIKLNAPGGGQKSYSELVNGNILIFKNVKWVQYTAAPDRVNRCTLEFRNCGMSFTISEIMVTPANTSDGVFEPYSGSAFPVTFPDGQTIYGGYVDPVAGEIVATFKKINLKNKAWYYYTSNQFALTTDKKLLSEKVFCDMLPVSKINGYPTDDKSIGFWGNGQSYSNIIFIKYEASNDTNDFKAWLNSLESDPCLIYEFDTPIHIPIPAQDLQAFLDRNNFWSDANDITEVTYPVTESKDILTTRKKAIAFDHAHHKKVKWNQLAPAISSPAWYAHSSDISTAQFDNGVATLTTIGETDQQYRHALVTRHSSNFWVIGHKYYLRQDVLLDQNGYCICVFGNEWGAQRYVSKNVWTTITDAHVTNSTSRNIFGLYPYGSLPIGTVRKVKNIMLFDLTQMFGEGNEPSASKFEHICEINGIDLTTYQPYDEGSDRWLIVP